MEINRNFPAKLRTKTTSSSVVAASAWRQRHYATQSRREKTDCRIWLLTREAARRSQGGDKAGSEVGLGLGTECQQCSLPAGAGGQVRSTAPHCWAASEGFRWRCTCCLPDAGCNLQKQHGEIKTKLEQRHSWKQEAYQQADQTTRTDCLGHSWQVVPSFTNWFPKLDTQQL